jgi:hypothetical protein
MKYTLVRPELSTPSRLDITVTSEDFDAICKGADQLGGTWDVLMDVPWAANSIMNGQEGLYVVTITGTAYWRDGRGRTHQISSEGFCWDCLNGQDGHTRRGLVRHPITPQEILDGKCSYICAVEGCGAVMNLPDSNADAARHKDIPHVITWGEETHPKCEACGKAYQIVTPDGLGYFEHAEGCENS